MDPPVEGRATTFDPVEVVREHYQASMQSLVPTSRNLLAKQLAVSTGLTHREALDVVDRYCDEENLPVPAYLSREFGVGWLKVLAIMMVLLAGGILWYGRTLHQQRVYPWGLWCLGAVCCCISVLFWLKSLELEAKNAKADNKRVR